MADTSPQATSTPGGTQTKKTSGGQKKAKNPKAKATHPPTSEMVNNAIKNLKERGGSSLQAVKKYIAANYKIDAEKLSPFIKKYLKAAVVSGSLIQTKGKGASGSFKLSSVSAAPKIKQSSGDKKPTPKPSAAKKTVTATTKAKVASKKNTPSVKPKANVAKKSPVAVKGRKAVVEKKVTKSPSKVKRLSKGPTKKLKAPKPKRTKPTVGVVSPAKGAKKAQTKRK